MSNKTRKWRSAIAMVLVICMLFSIFPVAAFADTTSGGVEVTPSVDYDINCDGTVNYVALGDSMTNDIRGAAAVGMNTCYYNPRGKKIPDDIKVQYEIHGIGELLDILI